MDMMRTVLVGTLAACTVSVAAFAAPDGAAPPGAPGDSLGLEQCIEIAIDNSTEISVADGNILKAEMGLKDAWTAFLPEIDLSGGYNLTDTFNRLEWNDNHYSLTLGATMTPFDGGRNLINTAKSKEGISSAKQNLRLAEIGLIVDVMSKYYGLLQASDILGLRRESVAQSRTHLRFAQAQYDLGLVPRSDVLKAEVNVISGEVDSLNASGNLDIARAELNNAMGITLDRPIAVQPVTFTRQAPPDIEQSLDEALKNRPELIRQKSSMAVTKYNLRLAQLNRWPTLILTGSYNAYVDRFVFDGLPLNGTNWEDNTAWRVGVGLSFPVFDGGVAARAVRSARIDVRDSELGYTDLTQQVYLDVESAHLTLVTALKRIDLTEKQVESAQESYDAAYGRYKNGVAPITEVIDATVALSNSKVNHTQATYSYLLAEAQLKQAVGRLPYQVPGRSQ
jgi:outer membrane protein